jgi:exodeoxyribonuclease VIII
VKGSALHASILTPDEFDSLYAVGPDVRRNSKEWKAFEESHPGKELLKPSESADVLGMRQSIERNALAARLFATATEREMTLVWTDNDTGLRCKARADLYGNGLLIDLKTTSDARTDKFCRWAFDFGYPLQFAWYWRGLIACGLACESIAILAVENTAPWNVVVFEPSIDWFVHGEKQLRSILPDFVACRQTNNWPGYVRDDSIQTLTLPSWA